MNINITDIRTELFTQVTICDFGNCKGVKIIQFDDVEWQKDSCPDFKALYLFAIIIRPQGISMQYRGIIQLTSEQLDEIQRISKILREEK